MERYAPAKNLCHDLWTVHATKMRRWWGRRVSTGAYQALKSKGRVRRQGKNDVRPEQGSFTSRARPSFRSLPNDRFVDLCIGKCTVRDRQKKRCRDSIGKEKMTRQSFDNPTHDLGP